MKTDAQLISEYRQRNVALLEAAIEEELAREYIVYPCDCRGGLVHRATAKFCGNCGVRLPGEEATG